MRVPVRSFDFKNAIVNCKQGDVKGSASQVKYKDVSLALAFFVKTVGNSCRCRLVNNALHV